ncbi:spore germination protein [Paenibacillus alginolyticus]|uniref:spore germination protein n=1 Tax=Paenibacillus alginolyticus TaxID=59839 RepID=UPI0035E42755
MYSKFEEVNEKQQPIEIAKRLDWLQQNLSHCSDIAYHTFVAGPELTCSLVYLKGMVDRKMIQEHILKVITSLDPTMPTDEFINQIFQRKRLPVDQQHICHSMQDGQRCILNGDVLLLIDGNAAMLTISVSMFEKRAITEAQNETVIRGPREAFVENLESNLTLLRKRLRTPSFKIDIMQIGKETSTSVAIVYIEGKCKPTLLEEVKRRLSQIEMDAVLGSSYIEECIEDHPYSPFPQLQYTERPDTVCASLLEGRVALIVDGTPIVLIAPVTFLMFMQSAEDYYQRYFASSWIRLIRYLFLFVSLLLPSVFIAITTFHPDIIPERLLTTIASSREIVPFPALIEAFIMELSFEVLREASIRIPKVIGQSVSTVGALIIGTAAVEAGIASAAIVIIVSLTGVSSFIIPHFDLALAFRLLKFPIMILAGIFGLYGIACGMILIYLHLIDLRSFGVPYLSPIAPLQPNDLKDTLIRAPWWTLRTRPSVLTSNRFRQRNNSRKWAQEQEEEE